MYIVCVCMCTYRLMRCPRLSPCIAVPTVLSLYELLRVWFVFYAYCSQIARRRTRSLAQSITDLFPMGSSSSPDPISSNTSGSSASFTSPEALDKLLYGHMHVCSVLLLFREPGSGVSLGGDSGREPVASILAGYTEFEKRYLTPLTKVLHDFLRIFLGLMSKNYIL